MRKTAPESESPQGPEIDFDTAFQHVVGEVFRFRGMLIAAGERATRDLNISVGCWQAMGVIRDEAMTVADISRRLGLARQSVQQSVNRLRDQELVETIPNPSHRRAPLIRLTASGNNTMNILRRRQAQIAARFTADLGYTEDDLNALAARLRKMWERGATTQEDDFDW